MLFSVSNKTNICVILFSSVFSAAKQIGNIDNVYTTHTETQRNEGIFQNFPGDSLFRSWIKQKPEINQNLEQSIHHNVSFYFLYHFSSTKQKIKKASWNVKQSNDRERERERERSGGDRTLRWERIGGPWLVGERSKERNASPRVWTQPWPFFAVIGCE